jgi:soluble lytic murein transglycosylase
LFNIKNISKGTLCISVGILGVFTAFSADNVGTYDLIIGRAAKRHSLDPLLVKAVIWRESGFNPDARGSAGEAGLMQIRNCAASDWAGAMDKPIPSESAMFNPAVNIEIGCWYLSRALSSWNKYRYSRVLALCEYNAGRSRVREWLPPRKHQPVRIKLNSTRFYVKSILNKYAEYASSGALAQNY